MIQINGLDYRYPGAEKRALRDINWQVEPGEFVLVTGASGSGKSTLLRCLNGLTPHFSGGEIAGSVQVRGIDIISASPARLSREVGFVFQNPEAQAVVERVEGELAFALENQGGALPTMQRQVNQALEQLNITHLRHRKIETLSGGERQRTAIASGMVWQPSLLVLDEPTSQLDPPTAQTLLETLLKLNQEAGLTIILAEHRLDRTLPFVSRVTAMENGAIALDGLPQQVAPQLAQAPPVVVLGARLGWQPVPLSVSEFREKRAQNPLKTNTTPRKQVAATSKISQLSAEGLTFAYAGNRHNTLSQINLTINQGEIVGLLGSNGAGKTTLMNCLTGLLPASHGTIRLQNEPINDWQVAERCRHIGYLPQNPDDLLFADTVQEELLITLNNHAILPETAPIPPDELLMELGLSEQSEAYPRDLSVGQRQRTAFGAIAVTAPQILLLDEPTRGLDWEAKQRLAALCRGWAAKGAGLLIASHDVELIAGIADQIYILENGRVAEQGSPRHILPNRPEFAPQIAQLFPEEAWITLEDVCLE